MNSIRGQWHPQGLGAWPLELPSGSGGDWWGWSRSPEPRAEWSPGQRSLVHDVMAKQYESAGLDAPSSLTSLTRTGARVVTVGHQLVIAGGPAFLHHKILSAIHAARELERRWEGAGGSLVLVGQRRPRLEGGLDSARREAQSPMDSR